MLRVQHDAGLQFSWPFGAGWSLSAHLRMAAQLASSMLQARKRLVTASDTLLVQFASGSMGC